MFYGMFAGSSAYIYVGHIKMRRRDIDILKHIKKCRPTTPTSTKVVLILSEFAKFNTLTRHWKWKHNFRARTILFTRQSLDDPIKQEVVGPTQWPLHLWLVVDGCEFHDSVATHAPTLLAQTPSD
jgi:hypothetical protein